MSIKTKAISWKSGNKLRTYRKFKHSYGAVGYLELNVPYFKRKYFSMLRAACLPIAIETGRFAKPPIPLSQRICTFCNMNCVEDEEHFLMNCSLYSDIRGTLVDMANAKLPGFSDLNDHERF